MTESVRKRTSKWDLKDESVLPTERRHEHAWLVKVGKSTHDKESSLGGNSLKASNTRTPKWSDMEANDELKSKDDPGWSCWESMPGNRSTQKDNSNNRDFTEASETTMAWGACKNYSTSMSPGLDAWRQHNHSHSPKSGWSRSYRSSRSRSRSRSPHHGLKREGWNGNSRSGSGGSARLCKDFAAGRCRRGSQCRFLHQESQSYEDRRYSESGPGDRWGTGHEQRGSSNYANNEEPRDLKGLKNSHGYGNHYDGNCERDEHPRNRRSTSCCNDFLKGKCYRGSTCKYAHHGASSDGNGGGFGRDTTGQREQDRRDRISSSENNHRHEFRRTGTTPCKYFAAGNCRNGENCRFSHECLTCSSPEGRLQEDSWCNNLDNENKSWAGPKWSDKTSGSDVVRSVGWGDNKSVSMNVSATRANDRSKDDRWGNSLDDDKKAWGGPTWGDKASDRDIHESSTWRNENDGASMDVSKFNSMGKSLDAADIRPALPYPHQINKEGPRNISTSQTLVGSSLPIHEPFRSQEISGHLHLSATVTQSPAFGAPHDLQHPSLRMDSGSALPLEDINSDNENAGSVKDMNFSPIVTTMVPVPGPSFNQGDKNVSAESLSSFNTSGQGEQTLPPNGLSGLSLNLNGQMQKLASYMNPQSETSFNHRGPVKTPEMAMSHASSGTLLNLNVATSEQVAQMTNLSASLAQIFGNSQQLPQLYAALNPPTATGLMPPSNSAGLAASSAASSIQPSPATWSQKQYDPLSDSIESNGPAINNHPPGFSTYSTEQKNTTDADQKIESKNSPSVLAGVLSASDMRLPTVSSSFVAGAPNGGDPRRRCSTENESNGGDPRRRCDTENELQHGDSKSKRQEPVVSCEAKETTETVVKESNKEDGNGHLDDVNVESQADEAKKNKDAKGMRAFRFALVEFVKEILKPTWKEGQMSKEAHKTIVKKVVDKVTCTIQGAQIPQTQEKIDHYLSYSKPKLTKLVQGYVEKYLKS